jgi:hypothetical protein
MKTLRSFIAGTALVVMSAGLAGATTTGYTTITPGGGGFTNTDFSYALTLPKFDGSLGTLTGVKIFYYSLVQTTALSLTNNSTLQATFDVDINSRPDFGGLVNSANAADNYAQETLTLLSLVGITLGPTGSGPCAPSTPTASCNMVSYAPPAISTDNSGFGAISGVGDGTRTVTGVQKIVGAANYGLYTGAGGFFNLSGTTKSQSAFGGGGGNINVTQSTSARFEAEVDYTYTPAVVSSTPEPTTMILFGSALVGLGFLRKKK